MGGVKLVQREVKREGEKRNVCVYLPSCVVQGSSGAHSVLSPYPHISNISLNLCILVASTISSFNMKERRCVSAAVALMAASPIHPILAGGSSS